jgi:hypothetical protein
MLAVTAGAFLLVTWVATKALFFFLQEAPTWSIETGKKFLSHEVLAEPSHFFAV